MKLNAMKKILAFIVFLILSLSDSLMAQDTQNSPMVGNDRDKHGCIGSAGYTWSVLKKQCVRSFELTQQDKNVIELASADNTQKMIILFSGNKSKVEVFYSEGNKVINKSAKGNFYLLKNENNIIQKLISVKGKWQFVKMIHGKTEVLYQ
jgi:hypothetical protein